MMCESCISADADSPAGVVAFCSEACAFQWSLQPEVLEKFVFPTDEIADEVAMAVGTRYPYVLLPDADTPLIVEHSVTSD